MMSRVTDFALGILWLLIDKICGIIGISKIEFFNFCGAESVNKPLDLQY